MPAESQETASSAHEDENASIVAQRSAIVNCGSLPAPQSSMQGGLVIRTLDSLAVDPPPIITDVQALELVQSFFGHEWRRTSISDVDFRPIPGGFANRLHLLTRHTKVIHEPASVLIRHFGTQGPPAEPPVSNTTLSPAEQAVVYYEMGRRGWGPKLYGVFPGGRLEEWIDAHPLTAEESMDMDIRKDIARAYANLHSLDFPLRKERFPTVVDELKVIASQMQNTIQTMLTGLDERTVEFAEIVRSMHWIDELDWVAGLFEKHHCRTAFVIGDANYLNVLVKNNKHSDCRVMLIDYETLSHGYRGFDLGGHFNERMYCWSHPSKVITGYPAATYQEQEEFCHAYMQQLRLHGERHGATDTIAHLLLETKIGRMFHILFSIIMCFLEDPSENPIMYTGLTHMLNVYHKLKNDID